ncbi:MAG: alpha/beta hydrolase [Pseudomonadota bacterium]
MSAIPGIQRPIRRPGLRARVLNAVLRRYLKRPADRAPENLRIKDEHLARGARRTAKMLQRNERVPGYVKVQPVQIPTAAGAMDAEWLSSARAGHSSEQVVLYFHGGGYFMCSAATHRPLTARLAHVLKRRVLSINYRQAPDHRFPAWLDDALDAYRFLLAEGYAPEKIALGGDSAGGNLVLVTLQQIRNENLPMPGAAFCISPWADMACEGASLHDNQPHDVMFSANGLRALARYHARDADPRHPLLSPVHADFRGFPPLLIQASSTEILRDDSRRVAQRARAAGVNVTLEEWHDLPHVFHLFADFIPEGGRAIRHIGRFVRTHA